MPDKSCPRQWRFKKKKEKKKEFASGGLVFAHVLFFREILYLMQSDPSCEAWQISSIFGNLLAGFFFSYSFVFLPLLPWLHTLLTRSAWICLLQDFRWKCWLLFFCGSKCPLWWGLVSSPSLPVYFAARANLLCFKWLRFRARTLLPVLSVVPFVFFAGLLKICKPPWILQKQQWTGVCRWVDHAEFVSKDVSATSL